MRDFSEELLSRIIKARRVHAITAFISLIAILILVWTFQYSKISGSFGLKVIFCIFALPIGYFVYSYANAAFKVNCPRCNELVEQGRLPSDPVPKSCKKCGLAVHD